MVYECEHCDAALPAGVTACPRCGEKFDDAVPTDAEVPKSGFRAVRQRLDQPTPALPPSGNELSDKVIEAQKRTKAATDSKSAGAGCVALIIIAVLVGVGINSCGSSSSSSQSNTSQSSASVSGEQLTDIGNDGLLRYTDDATAQVLVGSSKDDFDKLNDAIAAKDTIGEQQIIDRGGAFFVSAGTKAKLLGLDGFGVYHIRVETGNHNTQEAWVNVEALRTP